MRVLLVLTIATTVSVLMGQRVASQAGQLTGTVRDVCGRTLPGTAVSLANESGTVAQTVVDGRGRYSIGAVRPGPWVLTFALLAFRSQEEHILVSDHPAVELNVRLLTDPTLKEELTVTHGDPNVRYRKYLVHGVVSTLTGEPIRAATVQFREVGPQTSVGEPKCARRMNSAGLLFPDGTPRQPGGACQSKQQVTRLTPIVGLN